MSPRPSLPRHLPLIAVLGILSSWSLGLVATTGAAPIVYELLATKKTSTMQRELSEAAARGFRFEAVMGGETMGGSEVVVILSRRSDTDTEGQYEYLMLATSKTSTMQQELQAAADDGYEYRGQTVFNTAFGGEEVVIILERDRAQPGVGQEYMLLGTSKTSTMLKELNAAGEDRFELVGLTVASTTFGGDELVAILRRPAAGEESQESSSGTEADGDEADADEADGDADEADAAGTDADDGDAGEADADDTASPDTASPDDR